MAASPTTARHATRWSPSRCLPDRPRSRSRSPGRRGWSPTPCWRRGRSRARCRVGAPPLIQSRRSRCPRRSLVVCVSRPRGSSPHTSSPTRRGARPAAIPRRRSPTAARSAARPRRRSAQWRASSPTALDAPCVSCTRARTSSGSAPSARRSRRRRSFDGDGRARSRARSSATPRPFTRADRVAVRDRGRRSSGRAWPRPVRRPRPTFRAVGLAERAVLLEGALHAAGADRGVLVRARPGRVGAPRLRVSWPRSGALAGARVHRRRHRARSSRVHVRVAAGDPLDEVVLRSYCIGAAHMALGWVLTEGLAVDPETGEVHDLTIRSFGIVCTPRTRRRSTSRSSTIPARPSCPCVRRGVRGGRGRDVERGERRRGRASRVVPCARRRAPRLRYVADTGTESPDPAPRTSSRSRRGPQREPDERPQRQARRTRRASTRYHHRPTSSDQRR